MRVEWQHAMPDLSHAAEPHYDGTGHWVCFVCRQPVNDAGRTIPVSLGSKPHGIFTAVPDQTGLEQDGS